MVSSKNTPRPQQHRNPTRGLGRLCNIRNSTSSSKRASPELHLRGLIDNYESKPTTSASISKSGSKRLARSARACREDDIGAPDYCPSLVHVSAIAAHGATTPARASQHPSHGP